jgi:uncharacterized membrane protein SpoIIM required for sporulation
MSAGSRSFRLTREPEWRRLEDLLALAEKKSVRALGDDDLMALPVLYRGALSSLSVARETSLDLELVTYLEGLCARAYFFVYGVRTSPRRRLNAFFQHDWPVAVRSLWRETIVSALLFAAGILAGFLLVTNDPSWFSAFVGEGMSQGRDFSASTAHLRGTLYDGDKDDMLGLFATFLFTHNAQVAIGCFALGFAFGVPTSLLIIMNGAGMGAFLALFSSRGLGAELGGWLAIHGTTEIFAIILAGAAGLRIGWAVVFPGESSRLAAATEAGRTAAIVMAGVVLMLFAAGLLEGYGRQLITSDTLRYLIGAGMLSLWLLYYFGPRRPADG